MLLSFSLLLFNITVMEAISNFTLPLYKPIDLTSEMLQRAFYNNTLSRKSKCAWIHKMIIPVKEKRNVNVLVIGGSMTFGSELAAQQHPWPYHLEKIFGDDKFKVVNLAIPGAGVEYFVENNNWIPENKDANLIIIDLCVNDQSFDTNNGEDFEQLVSLYSHLIEKIYRTFDVPAILGVLSFRTANNNAYDKNLHCANEPPLQCCNGL